MFSVASEFHRPGLQLPAGLELLKWKWQSLALCYTPNYFSGSAEPDRRYRREKLSSASHCVFIRCFAPRDLLPSHGDASARVARSVGFGGRYANCQGRDQGIQLQEDRAITRRRFALLSSCGSPSRSILRGCESECRIQRSLTDITPCSVSLQSFTDRTCSYLQALSCSSENIRV